MDGHELSYPEWTQRGRNLCDYISVLCKVYSGHQLNILENTHNKGIKLQPIEYVLINEWMALSEVHAVFDLKNPFVSG